MNNYTLLFKKITGKDLAKRFTDYESEEEIDETIFETVSRLFFQNRKAFYHLKEKIVKIAGREEKDTLLLSTAAYLSYVNCDFEKAEKFLKKSIKINPRDLEQWFCLAFCFRQLGKNDFFDKIIMNYQLLIQDFHKNKDINKALNKNFQK